MRRFIVFVSALAAPLAVRAQPAASFAELSQQIELGETVTVTLDQGQVVGRAVDVTPTSLTVMVAGALRQLDETAVTGIRQRWDDPLKDGAVRGFLWGSIPAALVYIWAVKEDGAVPEGTVARGLLGMVGFAGGVGAGFGALTDRGIRAERDIYRRAAERVRVQPLLSNEGFGAAVAASW